MPPVPSPASASARSITCADAEPIDVLHREDVHLRRAHQLLFDLVEIADADEHGVLPASTAGRSPPMRASSAGSEPSSAASGMPCTLPESLVSGRVHVAVRVHPDQAELLAALAQERRRRRHRSGAEAVIAAEHDRHRAFVERAERRSETASGRRARSPSRSACGRRRRLWSRESA